MFIIIITFIVILSNNSTNVSTRKSLKYLHAFRIFNVECHYGHTIKTLERFRRCFTFVMPSWIVKVIQMIPSESSRCAAPGGWSHRFVAAMRTVNTQHRTHCTHHTVFYAHMCGGRPPRPQPPTNICLQF